MSYFALSFLLLYGFFIVLGYEHGGFDFSFISTCRFIGDVSIVFPIRIAHCR